MRLREIQRVKDLRASQGRVVLWLACGHKPSHAYPSGDTSPLPSTWIEGGMVNCPYCPDPPPVVQAMEEKTAQQLWREAGEP